MKEAIIIGYSGHAFVVCDILLLSDYQITGYCERGIKSCNPYHLKYLGHESEPDNIEVLKSHPYFTAIGSNSLRYRINQFIISQTGSFPLNAIHKNASISRTCALGHGIMIGNGSIINSCCIIENGVICNTQSVVEHECSIGAYTHIATGAVICGNVKIGANSFIGAGAVIKQGVRIGENVTIGAATVVLRDIPNNSRVVGNPQRFLTGENG